MIIKTDPNCVSDVFDNVNYIIGISQEEDFKKIQRYVLATVVVLVFQLGFFIKPFVDRFVRLVAWASYLLVPVLISYILGLIGKSKYVTYDYNLHRISVNNPLLSLSCVWVIFLLFAYAGFDNLNAFKLEERHERSKLVLAIGTQFFLLVLIMRELPGVVMIIPIVCVFLVMSFKFAGRLLALAHSAGATKRIKTEVFGIIDYMNTRPQDDVDDDVDDDDESERRDDQPDDLDPMTMRGYNYLVGCKYSKPAATAKKIVVHLENIGDKRIANGDKLVKILKKRIVDGVTVEKIWGCQGRLLSSGNMHLKDTCLSFALFWLLLGKFSGFCLYKQGRSSRAKAWKLVRHGLLADAGGHERVFRVIEVELAFLHDYFHSRYIFFYLNGFYWKLINIIPLPVMFWWFNYYSTDGAVNDEKKYGGFSSTKIVNTTVISVILALEVIQLVVFLNSRWLMVTLVCLYVKRMTPTLQKKPPGRLSRRFFEVIGSVFLGSSHSSNSARWRKPWKRELDQFYLIQSHSNTLPQATRLYMQVVKILGISLQNPYIKKDPTIALSEQVKKAVVLSLQRSNKCMLSNGAASLRRNRVEEELSWACNLKSEIEIILVWHIATSFCEMHPSSQSSTSTKDDMKDDVKVATSLSKYGAYLLFLAPSLLPSSALEAENICDPVLREVRQLFKEPIFSCRGRRAANLVNYKKMVELINDDMEIGSDPKSNSSILVKGATLGNNLVTLVRDEDKRWKILAEFWAELILFLAPSNSNEMAHADKLSKGGEFITHLWALLIHAGITNRDEITTAFQQDDDGDDESQQPGVNSA